MAAPSDRYASRRQADVWLTMMVGPTSQPNLGWRRLAMASVCGRPRVDLSKLFFGFRTSEAREPYEHSVSDSSSSEHDPS